MILACNLLLYSMLACYVNYKIFSNFIYIVKINLKNIFKKFGRDKKVKYLR